MTTTSQRELLVTEAIEFLRCRCQDELALIGPDHWDASKHEELVEEQIAGSRRILDALELRELFSHTSLEIHGDGVIAELRARIHQEVHFENQKKQA